MTETERGRRPTDASTRKPFERLPLWARLLAALPFPFWYAFSSTFAWLGEHVFRYRRQVVDMQIRKCFPEFDENRRRRLAKAHFQVLTRSVLERTLLWWASRQRATRRRWCCTTRTGRGPR